MPTTGWTRAVRTGLLALATASALALASSGATAADHDITAATMSAAGNMRFLPLGIGKSVVVDLPRDVKDVLVADPRIANAVVRSAQRAYLIGVTVGQTNVFFFDAAGQQIAAYDIAVTRDLNGIRAALKQALPDADIRVEGLGDGVVLSGSASNQDEAQQANNIASRLVGSADRVVNSIAVRGRDQVMLKVTVAEVQRDVIKQLGMNISGSLNYGTAVVNFNNATPFTAYGRPLVAGNQFAGTFKSVTATLQAMERAGVVRTLAEPNLTAISGESANFLAGGEFPIPKGYTCDPVTRQCAVQIEFKKFGISMGFTPVVLSEGRISLKVATEVSELSTEDALLIGDLQIPAIKTRRADTTVEIPSGGSLAMAGLIAEQTKTQMNGLPGLMQLPILGTLFKSRDYVNRQTELMIIVSPYIVRAVAQKELSRPDDGFADAADPAGALLANINRVYGGPNKVDPTRTYTGNVGFIRD
jgi:pilus assembly protein CpaC